MSTVSLSNQPTASCLLLTMCKVDGAEWKAQRKLTATCFNDQVNKIVWSEAVCQAEGMLDYWTSRPSVKTVAADTRTLSLNILSRAGFGKSFKFEGDEEKKGGTGLPSNYKEALQTILENCIFIMALGPEFFAKPWLPKSMRALHDACSTFQQYMTTLYEEEKKAFAEGRTTEKNLVNSLVRASEDQTKTGEGLTEKQIYGNIFVFNFAGHDTTAHTFCFAIFFLAAHPEVQDWVHEEISHVLGSRPTSEWDFEADFPRLKRCLALMLETLRLYTPVPVSKWTGNQYPSLNIGSKTVVLPPRTMVIPSYAAVHVQPQYWGADSLVWRPSRFIQRRPNASTATKPGEENIIPIQPGTFLGWSEGARDCPGRKFSQVEFVATMATLFREWTVEPVLLQGETPGQARQRVLDLIHNESQPVLLLQMLHPEKAPLVWKRR
jgi:cytochrome P450